jgi:protoporphyrinogen oxidase
MMWQRFQDAIVRQGGAVLCNTPVRRITHKDGGVLSISIPLHGRDGTVSEEIAADHVISSMPMTELIQVLDPPPPREVQEAAAQLSFRGLIVVGLIINRAELFPDNWIYVHSPDVRVGRIQNPKNWSRDLVPDEGTSSLAMEYFCTEADELWRLSDQQLVAMARREVAILGFAREEQVVDGTVFRQPKAYPVYETAYRQHVEVVQNYLAGFHNLQTVGRNGMHRYNNQDHSMVTGMLAVKNLAGAAHDLWSVNTERAYYEEEQR